MHLERRVGRELFRAIPASQAADEDALFVDLEVGAPLLHGQTHPVAVLADAAVGVGLWAEGEDRRDALA